MGLPARAAEILHSWTWRKSEPGAWIASPRDRRAVPGPDVGSLGNKAHLTLVRFQVPQKQLGAVDLILGDTSGLSVVFVPTKVRRLVECIFSEYVALILRPRNLHITVLCVPSLSH